ncbi:MAG: AGE family epimerase/isomerase [Bacteroidales bacterium]|nr:AGE family epimerase/isomerase [Bacteroidales bacterium]
MKRRKFLIGSAATASGMLMGINGCGTKEGKSVLKDSSVANIDSLAGNTLKQLLEHHRYYLFDDFLPFMDKYVVDHKFGGFMCNTDRDGTNITQKKTAWYEGRGIWVYSFLYNKIKKDPKYLEIAGKSVEYILKNEPTGERLWPDSFSREGKPDNEASDVIYGDLFIATGLSEYSKATGEDKYWDKAKEILLKCFKIYNKSDYGFIQDIEPQENHNKGPRVLGHWMILIRLVTQMLENRSDPELEKIADKCIDAIMNYHYNPEYCLHNEIMNHDLSRPEGPFSQYVCTGHAIETMWMLLDVAVRRKDKELFDLATERFRRHVEVAWDDVYGGVFHDLYNVNKNIWKTEKSLWAQEEVLVGAMMLIEHTGAQWAIDLYNKVWDYVIDKFPLKQYGYPIWILYADRKITFEKHYDRVGHFHHPRHLMLNILSLERILESGGEVNYETFSDKKDI